MENILIKNCPIIKKVPKDITVLENFEAGKIQVENTKQELKEQIILLINEVEEQRKLLRGLLSEKEDLQSLVIKGNAGLTAKLMETNKRIKETEANLKEAEENLKDAEELQKEQGILLEQALYSEFIETGALQGEFNNNAEALQLQYYSLLYNAFEVAQQLQGLELEYRNSVEYAFREAYPYKTFVETFPHRSFINNVRNNFPNYNLHLNTYNNSYIYDFINKFDALKDNKDFTFYK